MKPKGSGKACSCSGKMAGGAHPTDSHCAEAGGFSLMETVMATLLVGLLLTAVLNNVGATMAGRYNLSERSRGYALANDLMGEVVNSQYQEPTDTPLFGRESGEVGTVRSQWDDVDDFNGWSESPLQRRDGTVIPNTTGWTRSVTVERVNPDNLTQTVGTESGAKRITVTVKHGDRVVGKRVVVRTSGV